MHSTMRRRKEKENLFVPQILSVAPFCSGGKIRFCFRYDFDLEFTV